MPTFNSNFDVNVFIKALGGYYDAPYYWVHHDHDAIMVAAGFKQATVKDDIHGGRRPMVGGVGHYWFG